MNELIHKFAEEAEGTKKHVPAVWQFYDHELEKFAELIVRECSAFVYNYPEKYLTRNQAREICMSMEEQFGIEETKGWVCPRCGVDRTKTICPHGYTATIEGKCPMIGVAP